MLVTCNSCGTCHNDSVSECPVCKSTSKYPISSVTPYVPQKALKIFSVIFPTFGLLLVLALVIRKEEHQASSLLLDILRFWFAIFLTIFIVGIIVFIEITKFI